ncbi:expressed protein [Echinococcus multilocularis]|uniref:Expressed protein n=1 Tax=Echinococcus multilocularis TaxID=6211 RepID=A0A068YHS0_ECHMU|nr:expressed protein [Echinococcus multilocularis]
MEESKSETVIFRVSKLAGRHNYTSFGHKEDLDPQNKFSTPSPADHPGKHRSVLRSLFKGMSSGGKNVALEEQQPTYRQVGSSSHHQYHIHHYPHNPSNDRRPLRGPCSPHMSSSSQPASAFSSPNSSSSPGQRVSAFHVGLREEVLEQDGTSSTTQISAKSR